MRTILTTRLIDKNLSMFEDHPEFIRKIITQDQWSALEILDISGIPEETKLNMVFNANLLTESEINMYLCKIADRGNSFVPDPDIESFFAIQDKKSDPDSKAAQFSKCRFIKLPKRNEAWYCVKCCLQNNLTESSNAAAWLAAKVSSKQFTRDYLAWEKAWKSAYDLERKWQLECLASILARN